MTFKGTLSKSTNANLKTAYQFRVRVKSNSVSEKKNAKNI